MWTSAAPASRSMRTRARWVLPRTIESSTTTRRLPLMTSFSGFSFSLIPSWRIVWEGWIDVRPTYAFLTRPAPNGMPEASA
ncbi:hypothetical protein SALBM311S_04878 [Streptomyces alboniger]